MRGGNFVYEVAFELQEDLKLLSNDLGNKESEELIKKIIGALEALEWHVGRFEGRKREVGKLEEVVEKLEKEKTSRQKEKDLHEQDKKRFEELWSKESLDLMHSVQKLEEDNRDLQTQLEEALGRKREGESRSEIIKAMMKRKAGSSKEEDEIRAVHLRLKETLDARVEEVRFLKKEITQKNVDFDAMQQQCIEQSDLNARLCETICRSKLHSKRLIEEKSSMEARLLLEGRPGIDDVFSEMKEEKLDESIQLEEPVFSWEEVQEFWWERERLRSEVDEKQDRLLLERGFRNTADADHDVDPVQGPINKEPEDKLYGTSESGIRRFFQRLLKNNPNADV